jgi:hypothetical protein
MAPAAPAETLRQRFGVTRLLDRQGRVLQVWSGPEGTRHLARDRVGVDAQGLAVGVESDRRHDREDVLVEEALQHARVDLLDGAREAMVDALDDAGGMGVDRVGRGCQL